ncbi:uncharacterized protein LOC105386255 isoform X1 [Plutella xylostella]|uniref:uncharacterized protein LOC105386255 isoform X1 n=1 Tax=Plutella xylostella TaxID=51655 RepID=UPI002032A579|nr:uncharacterized protein LOC105386255 isoform X1 [Plutella xylostella]
MVAVVEPSKRIDNSFFRSFLPAVNSPPVSHRDHSAPSYRRNDDYAVIHRADRPPDEERKKDKKWSFGKLFRRKKKDDESQTSSESDEGISSRSRKPKKKKRVPPVNNFDHIVIRDTRRAQSVVKVNHRDYNDDGVLSDPSAGFVNYRTRLPQHVYADSKESLSNKDDMSGRSAKTTLETPARKTRKGRLKARVEALRNSMRGDSSSDEESLKSSNSSSMVRFRSDDSLMRSRDSSLNKRSRSARNERYVKRLSRDEENQLNKEAELLQQGYTKAEVEMLTRTPTSQSSGYGTCKKEQSNKVKQDNLYANDITRRPMKSESISSFPSTQSYPSSINFNAIVNKEHINYSIQYPNNNLNREPVYANNNRQRSVTDQSDKDVMCVKFPLGNVTNIKREEKVPPVPPPRDMQRKVTTPLSMYYENNAPAADRVDGSTKPVYGVPNNDFERVMRRSQDRTIGHGQNGLRRPISNSEDHIAMMNNEYLQTQYTKEQPRRPASVSAEPNHYVLYSNTPPWRKNTEKPEIVKPQPVQPRWDYLYYADQSPRSRRPISVKPSQNGHENQYLSDSQTSLNLRQNVYKRPQNASDFWKKLDDAERQKKQQNMFAHSRSNSDYTSNSQFNRNVNVTRSFDKPSQSDLQNRNMVKSRDVTDGANMWKATTEYKRSITVEPPKVTSPSSKTHVRHKSDTFLPNSYQIPSDDEKHNTERRKSTNLDDALNELEAIYNSLGLGDEDLLDRAERRELMNSTHNEHYNDWNGNDDEVQLRGQPTTPLRLMGRRSTLPDKLQDDMAFRKMNGKDKSMQAGKDTQSQISYMLASPVYVPYASDDDKHSERNEPDVVYDDVVYRNIKQMNNRLKTIEPQPPFGIPVGPVSPAPQSDYLHATPDNKGRSRFIPRRSPDLVSDDLAYRSLRKDSRHFNSFNGDEYIGPVNNNHSYSEYPLAKDPTTNLKKKRAVRSLSANIFTMIQKEIDEALTKSKPPSLQKTHSNSDVTRRLREVFENNDNEQEHYPRNKVKQRHHTVNLFVNNINAPPSHHFAKDDSYIHNNDKYIAKPSCCDKSKSSSPSNRSPQTSKRSSKDEFQQVLTMLAQEAMDTSNKLGVALAELDKNRNNNERKSDLQSKISDSRLNFLNVLKSGNDINEQIKYVNVHSEVISEPTIDKTHTKHKLDCTDSKSKAEKTEDSLMVISDQLHKVEDQLKHSFEKEINFDDESLKLSNYIAKTQEQLKAQETTVVVPDSKLVPAVIPLPVQNDAIKIESIDKIIESNPFTNKVNLQNTAQKSDEKLKELNEINAFKELKDGISDLIAGISQVNEKLFLPKSSKPETESQNISNTETQNIGKIATISEVSAKLSEVTQERPKIDDAPRASVNLSIYEDDLEVKKDNADSTEYNSSEELATIFKIENKARATAKETNPVESSIRTELSSPKLVQSMSQQLRRFSVDHTEDSPSQSNQLPTNIVPWRTKRHNSQNENQDTQRKREWHDRPSTVMLACSYTLMVTQHLAELDWLTLLGLMLAIVTIIAMMLI